MNEQRAGAMDDAALEMDSEMILDMMTADNNTTDMTTPCHCSANSSSSESLEQCRRLANLTLHTGCQHQLPPAIHQVSPSLSLIHHSCRQPTPSRVHTANQNSCKPLDHTSRVSRLVGKLARDLGLRFKSQRGQAF